MSPIESLREEPDWDYEAARILHWFPTAASIVGGDPLDLWFEKFYALLNAISDVEAWKAGEKDEDRKDRVFMKRMEGLVGS